METLTLQIMALGLGTIISPGLFAGTILLLGSKIKPLAKSLAFLLGNILSLLILIAIGFFVGAFVNRGSSSARYFDIAFGFLLLWFAYKAYSYKPNDKSVIKNENNSPRLFLLFSIGFIGSITNFDAETLYLIAMNEIFESGAAVIKECLLVLYMSIMILLPILLPLIFYYIFPKSSKIGLGVINSFLKKYGRAMMVLLFILLGAWFLIKGFWV